MKKRILLAGLYHETHSFLSRKSDLDLFRSTLFRKGQEVIDGNRGSGSPTDGFIEVADAEGWDVVGSIQMAAGPGGMVTEEVIETFESVYYPDLEAQVETLDAVFLVLHGAMVSEGRDDVEGSLLRETTRRLKQAGRDIPVIGVLDLHGNVSQEMVDNATLLVAYRENPHSDARATAVRAARLLARIFDGMAPRMVHRETPYVLPPVGVGTASGPMRAVLDRVAEIEAADREIVNVNVMAGYAYADIPMCGFSLCVATTGDTARAEGYLDDLQSVLEANLADGYPKEYTLDEALAKADALPPGDGPVLLVEPADNIGGGTPGDATGILGPLLQTGRKGIVAAIADPEAVAQCEAAGLGAEVTLLVGAKTDRYHGKPVPFTGTVKHLSDGRFTLENPKSHMASMGGSSINMGPSAVIENDQVTILLNSIKCAPMDLGHLHSQGIRPEDATFVIVKAAVSHKDAYDPIARASFWIDSEGLCTSNLTRLPYRKLTGKQISAT